MRPGELPPAAALVSTRFSRTAIALPILWHAVTLARSYRARRRETKVWLALDVIGLSWSLLPVAKASRKPAGQLATAMLGILRVLG